MRTAIVLLLVTSSVVAGAKRVAETARVAREVLRQPDLESRRALLFGAWYVAVAELRRATPANASIDFVMLKPEARDIAVLGAAELQPRNVRLFDGWEGWRRRERATLLHDARAANAVPGPSPGPAQFVVVVDPAAQPPLRLVR